MAFRCKPLMSLVVTRRVTPVGKLTLSPGVGRLPPCQLLGLLQNPLELPSQTAALADTAASKIAMAGSTGRNRAVKVSSVDFIEGVLHWFPAEGDTKKFEKLQDRNPRASGAVARDWLTRPINARVERQRVVRPQAIFPFGLPAMNWAAGQFAIG